MASVSKLCDGDTVIPVSKKTRQKTPVMLIDTIRARIEGKWDVVEHDVTGGARFRYELYLVGDRDSSGYISVHGNGRRSSRLVWATTIRGKTNGSLFLWSEWSFVSNDIRELTRAKVAGTFEAEIGGDQFQGVGLLVTEPEQPLRFTFVNARAHDTGQKMAEVLVRNTTIP